MRSTDVLRFLAVWACCSWKRNRDIWKALSGLRVPEQPMSPCTLAQQPQQVPPSAFSLQGLLPPSLTALEAWLFFFLFLRNHCYYASVLEGQWAQAILVVIKWFSLQRSCCFTFKRQRKPVGCDVSLRVFKKEGYSCLRKLTGLPLLFRVWFHPL